MRENLNNCHVVMVVSTNLAANFFFLQRRTKFSLILSLQPCLWRWQRTKIDLSISPKGGSTPQINQLESQCSEKKTRETPIRALKRQQQQKVADELIIVVDADRRRDLKETNANKKVC